MALPHAGYAGVAIVSEELVNFALNTYLANFLDNQHVQWQWTSPVTINGSTLSTTFSADATLVWLAASLKASNNQNVSFLGRFYAKAFLDLSLVPSFNAAHVAFTIPKQVGPIETGLDAEALIEFSLTAPLVAVSSGQGYQFGVDTQNAWITSITAHLISTTLPYEYLSALQDGLQAPLTQQVLNTFLHNLPPSTLRASVITTPDSFSYDVVRPQPPYPRWFSVSAPTPQFTWKQLDGAVIAAIDMPGFTSGSWQHLWDFREDELRAFGGSIYFPDLGSAINMQFLQDFVQRQIIPNMRDGFLTNTFPPIYLHQINRFEVKSISTPEEASRPGVEVECFVTVYTDESALFDLNGTSGVDVTVTIRGFLSLRNGRLGFTVTGTHYDVHLPLAVEITLFALALVLPPASF